MRPHIERLKVRNFGCLRDVDIALTPLHAFIGPNDSGKSTILRAVQTLTAFQDIGRPEGVGVAMGDLERPDEESADRTDQPTQHWRFSQIEASGSEWRLSARRGLDGEVLRLETVHPAPHPDERTKQHTFAAEDAGTPGPQPTRDEPRIRFSEAVASSRTVMLNSGRLARNTKLIPSDTRIDLGADSPFGLAAIYDTLLSRNVEAFLSVQQRVRELFPSVSKLRLLNTSGDTKALSVVLTTGKEIPAPQLSAGLLYYLAFAALPHLDPTSVVLVEEPENGLHPARIREVMAVLRLVSEASSQVLIATHSPLVVNELRPHEVSVVTREPERGTRVTPIRDTPNFEDRSAVYALGELWLSYADGELEKPLLGGDEA